MLKRLLTAVLVLGLIMVFSGTAFTESNNVPNTPEGGRTPQHKVSLGGDYRPLGYTSVNKVPIEGVIDTRPTRGAMPAPANADTTECYIFGWADWANASFSVSFARRTNTTSYNEMAMRYNGPSAPNTAIKLYGAYNWVRRVVEGAPDNGVINVTVNVYNAVAGEPGTLAYTENYALPTHGTTFDYTYFPFTNPPVLGGEYYIAFTIAPTNPTTDTVVWTSDDAGHPSGGTATITGRGRVRTISDGLWKTLPVATGTTLNCNFDQLADWCQVYTKCDYLASPLYNVWLYTFPSGAAPSGGRKIGAAQRFVPIGPDTVKTIYVYHMNYNVYYGGAFYTPTSTNGIKVMVFGDNGGNPDYLSGPLATVTLPGGPGLFPTTGLGTDGWNVIPVDMTPYNVVVRGPYHLAVEMTSANPADGRLLFAYADEDDPTDPAYVETFGGSVEYSAPGSPWENTGTSPDWQAQVGGGEVGFLIEGVVCHDEFAQCATVSSYYYGPTRWLYMDNCLDPVHYGTRNGIAGKMVGQMINRVEKIRFAVADEFTFDGYPNINSKIKVSVCAVAPGGNVGSVLWTKTLDEALGEINMAGWTEVVIPGGVTAINEFFVTLEPVLTLDGDTEWLYFGRERVGDDPSITGIKNDGMYVKLCADDLWYQNTPAIGGSGTDNATIEADICSVPPNRWTCTTPTDFYTATADFQRTSHAQVALSDAYCDLTLRWKYVDPLYNITTNRIGNSGPVVYDHYVFSGFGGRCRILDLNDGSVVGEMAGAGAPYYFPTSGMNWTPTIATVMVGGTPKPVMFIGAGVSTGYRAFSAYDLTTWVGTAPNAVPAQLWSINQTTWTALGYTPFPTGLPAHIGNTSWTNPIVTNIDGTDVVIFNTNDQYIWCANAATGQKVWGPIVINGLTYKGMAYLDGFLYVTNTPLLPTYPIGDITKWNAKTGAPVWALSSAPGGGMRGLTVGQDFGNETFVSGLALWPNAAAPEVYAVSSTPEVDDPSGAVGGILYRINGVNGAVLGTTLTKHYRQDGGLTTIADVMVDATTLVIAGGSRWAANGNQLFGYNRFTGGQNWEATEGNTTDNGHLYDGLLTCEAGETDLGFVTNVGGFLDCFNPVTGSMYFSRRFNNAANRGGAIGVSKEGDLLVADRNGAIFCLSKGVDRPRLEIIDWTPEGNTYGPLPSIPLTIPNVFYNSGCAPLVGTITYSTTSNGATLGAAPAFKAASIADQLTQESNSKMMLVAQTNFMESSTPTARPALNSAALATPPFFNVGTQAINLNPGDTAGFDLDVHQSLVYRGENVFYAWFNTNDEDYFLDSAGATRIDPQLRCMIVGGCLLDTATLHFGVGGANLQWVLNVPRMGHFGDTDNPFVSIAGNTADFYGGYYIYGVSERRIAMNTQDWWTGSGEAQAYKSLQGDPNECTTNCKPALLSGQTVGLITTNGASYAPLIGNVVCRTYLDSVQMWAPLDTLGVYGTWNWNNTWLTAGTYNNDSTMGLEVISRSIGFMDPPFPVLNYVVVDFMKIFMRYADGKPVPNWRMGEWIDYDLGGDTILFWPSLSACASVPTVTTRTTGAFGTIKLPYGGGCNSVTYPTMKNALSLEGNQSMNANAAAVHGNAYFDSVYYYMGLNVTNFSQGPMRTAPGDQRSHDTWINHSFADASDTLRMAIAHYGNPSQASPRDPNSLTGPLSILLNKWVGMNRGDVNNDNALNLADIVYLADYVGTNQFGPIPFKHCGDVDANGAVNGADVTYLVNYYFFYGDCPKSEYISY
ncbi:hypothetical protein C3F09_10640 [candidate division GN15 bacterium]|uniref:Dockerin domain-containing protein n=1 Tax=candidate division GN15 bacterium TaxID=2072418 RepID=A0A855WWE2_9BACT|nr:MAG: hypothetical protein C3F09_10640 [candidate division GN15 bacterium]